MIRARSYVFLKPLMPSVSTGYIAVVLAICIALVAGPFSQFGHGHNGDHPHQTATHTAGGHQSHQCDGEDGTTLQTDCCLVIVCAASFILAQRADITTRTEVADPGYRPIDDRPLRSLYGAGDPPVPRIDFS